MRPCLLLSLLVSPLVTCAAAAQESVETVRYLRPAGPQFASECVFTIKRSTSDMSIDSVTERGKTKLTVSSKYDDKDRLTSAEAVLRAGDKAQTAPVRLALGKATIERAGKPPESFDVPPGVIVTSAPDWTDTFLLCRRYDRQKGGKQSFPGLWIHPVESPQRLSFAIEKTGADTIVHAEKKLTLDRYTIWLRGKSSYAAWADAAGKKIKLVPLPYKDGAQNWLVLEGYEKSAAALRP